MSPADLEGALEAAGYPCRVEARERLAILMPRGSGREAMDLDRAGRRAIVEMARAHGFTHVAVEIGADARAALSRGQSG